MKTTLTSATAADRLPDIVEEPELERTSAGSLIVRKRVRVQSPVDPLVRIKDLVVKAAKDERRKDESGRRNDESVKKDESGRKDESEQRADSGRKDEFGQDDSGRKDDPVNCRLYPENLGLLDGLKVQTLKNCFAIKQSKCFSYLYLKL